MGNISIVTAFFDIGRSNWTQLSGHPPHLYRSNWTYIERFSHLVKLDNEIVVYTENKFVGTLEALSPRIKVIPYDYHNQHKELRERISSIQQMPAYKSLIHPVQYQNPEYWSADYVLVNLLKAHFVNDAIKNSYVNEHLVSWIDFGYCRSQKFIGETTSWRYNFAEDKIHLFSVKDLPEILRVDLVICTNTVYILGGKIVAPKSLWPTFQRLLNENLELLLQHNLIDDDQTILAMMAKKRPELFEIHRLPGTLFEPEKILRVFQDYNRPGS